MAELKKERKMKVYAQSGYKYKNVPTIIIKGDYLENFGFSIDTPISLSLHEGRIVIAKIEDSSKQTM